MASIKQTPRHSEGWSCWKTQFNRKDQGLGENGRNYIGQWKTRHAPNTKEVTLWLWFHDHLRPSPVTWISTMWEGFSVLGEKGVKGSLCWSQELMERGAPGVLGSTCQGCCGRVRPPLTALPHLSPLTCTRSSTPLICQRDGPDHWGLYRVTLAPGDGIPRGICSQQSVYGMPSDKWQSKTPEMGWVS